MTFYLVDIVLGDDVIKYCPEVIEEVDNFKRRARRWHVSEGHDVREINWGCRKDLRRYCLSHFQGIRYSPAIDQLININQSVNQSISQPVNQSINTSVKQLSTIILLQSCNEINESINLQSMRQLCNQYIIL